PPCPAMRTFPACSASTRGVNDLSSVSRAIAISTMACHLRARPNAGGDSPSASVAAGGAGRRGGQRDHVGQDVGAHAGTVEVRDVITPVDRQQIPLAELTG